MVKRTENQSLILPFPPTPPSTPAGVSSTTGKAPTPPPASPAPVTGLMTHGEGGGEAARARGPVMFVNLKKAMCGQAACSGRQRDPEGRQCDPEGRRRAPSLLPARSRGQAACSQFAPVCSQCDPSAIHRAGTVLPMCSRGQAVWSSQQGLCSQCTPSELPVRSGGQAGCSQCTPSVLQLADRVFPACPSGPAVCSQCAPAPTIPTRKAHEDAWHGWEKPARPRGLVQRRR